jgi:Flp pilus assembly protein TadG
MRSRRGSAALEFTLTGIPLIFLTLAILESSLAMWQFHTLAWVAEAGARYISVHGRGCTQNGNACTVTVGNIASVIAGQGLALDPGKLKVTLYSQSTSVTCNPLNSCNNNSAQFPSSADNGPNLDVKVVATYPVSNPIPMYWFGSAGSSGGIFNLSATSRQRIVF